MVPPIIKHIIHQLYRLGWNISWIRSWKDIINRLWNLIGRWIPCMLTWMENLKLLTLMSRYWIFRLRRLLSLLKGKNDCFLKWQIPTQDTMPIPSWYGVENMMNCWVEIAERRRFWSHELSGGRLPRLVSVNTHTNLQDFEFWRREIDSVRDSWEVPVDTTGVSRHPPKFSKTRGKIDHAQQKSYTEVWELVLTILVD